MKRSTADGSAPDGEVVYGSERKPPPIAVPVTSSAAPTSGSTELGPADSGDWQAIAIPRLLLCRAAKLNPPDETLVLKRRRARQPGRTVSLRVLRSSEAQGKTDYHADAVAARARAGRPALEICSCTSSARRGDKQFTEIVVTTYSQKVSCLQNHLCHMTKLRRAPGHVAATNGTRGSAARTGPHRLGMHASGSSPSEEEIPAAAIAIAIALAGSTCCLFAIALRFLRYWAAHGVQAKNKPNWRCCWCFKSLGAQGLETPSSRYRQRGISRLMTRRGQGACPDPGSGEALCNEPALSKNEAIARVLANAKQLEPPAWFEPFGDLQIEDQNEVMSMVSLVQPSDSVSAVGARSFMQPIAEMSSATNQHECTVLYMRTLQGQHIAAKVSTDGLESTSELLLGLRAAFVHYACSPNQAAVPALGALIFSFVMPDQTEMILREGHSEAERRPLSILLKCVHIIIDETTPRVNKSRATRSNGRRNN
eukprot:6213026-Pleurochrysis_carterae.AAC.2